MTDQTSSPTLDKPKNFNYLRFKKTTKQVFRPTPMKNNFTVYERCENGTTYSTENEERARGWNDAITKINKELL